MPKTKPARQTDRHLKKARKNGRGKKYVTKNDRKLARKTGRKK